MKIIRKRKENHRKTMWKSQEQTITSFQNPKNSKNAKNLQNAKNLKNPDKPKKTTRKVQGLDKNATGTQVRNHRQTIGKQQENDDNAIEKPQESPQFQES